tara:strand:- start:2407 stop:3117 length:711 start_codon:yes stop_codon:yes gene_type:complete
MADDTKNGNDQRTKAHYTGHRQRLKEKFLNSGGAALADYEILELLLCLAIPRRDVKPLAKTLIREFGNFAEAISAPRERLREIPGIGETAIAALKLAEASAQRLAQSRVLNKPVLSNWQALLDYCQISMGHQKKEQFRILFLDRKNRLIADEVQQEGTVDHTPVYPREVIKRALELQATAIILVHNHPSGDPTPSQDDILMTRKIGDVGKQLGILLHDHLIIARSGQCSFKTLGLL